MPPAGTPITILLKPILPGKPAGKQAAAAKQRHAEAEQKAVQSAEPWLALVDQGQYSRSWETAADFFKNAVDTKGLCQGTGRIAEAARRNEIAAARIQGVHHDRARRAPTAST